MSGSGAGVPPKAGLLPSARSPRRDPLPQSAASAERRHGELREQRTLRRRAARSRGPWGRRTIAVEGPEREITGTEGIMPYDERGNDVRDIALSATVYR